MLSKYINLLTDEEKAAFAKGDAYYVSPFKGRLKGKEPRVITNTYSTGIIYTTTSYSRIHEACADRIASRQW